MVEYFPLSTKEIFELKRADSKLEDNRYLEASDDTKRSGMRT